MCNGVASSKCVINISFMGHKNYMSKPWGRTDGELLIRRIGAGWGTDFTYQSEG